MRRIRVIPALLLDSAGLVKTLRFRNPVYVGDPINAMKIFNEKEVDELMLLDVTASRASRAPDLDHIADIASEAFMPVSYGGGISTLQQVERLLRGGIEKVVINTAAAVHPELVTEAARQFGNQSVVVSADVRKSLLGSYRVFTAGGSRRTGRSPVDYCREMEDRGAGEILLTAVEREGTRSGYDLDLARQVTSALGVPVVLNGGAGKIEHFVDAVRIGGASAVAAGSKFVFQGSARGILISYPDQDVLRDQLFQHQ
jgi:cyclase